MNWHEQGLIPGPEETEKDFKERAFYCLEIEKEIAAIPFDPTTRAGPEVLQEGHERTRSLYGIAPNWIPLFFSNYKLAPWHGGCAWIVQMQESAPLTALFQLRERFQHRDCIGGYSRQETIAHELAHVGRMAFEEPKFEEILAYRSSLGRFRRFFGPMIQSSKESMLFVIVLLTLLLYDLYSLLGGYPLQLWPKLAAVGFVGLALCRVTYRQWQFSRCLRQLTRLLDSQEKAGQVAYCLTDTEIIRFGKWESSAIHLYAKTQESPRWQHIRENLLI